MRIKNETSLHDEEKPNLCLSGHSMWRTVECCGPNSGPDTDIIECSRCGQQRKASCNFDEDYD